VHENGKPVEIQGIVRDLTQRRQNDDEVRKLSLVNGVVGNVNQYLT
jgi:hypothetical protein